MFMFNEMLMLFSYGLELVFNQRWVFGGLPTPIWEEAAIECPGLLVAVSLPGIVLYICLPFLASAAAAFGIS